MMYMYTWVQVHGSKGVDAAMNSPYGNTAEDINTPLSGYGNGSASPRDDSSASPSPMANGRSARALTVQRSTTWVYLGALTRILRVVAGDAVALAAQSSHAKGAHQHVGTPAAPTTACFPGAALTNCLCFVFFRCSRRGRRRS